MGVLSGAAACDTAWPEGWRHGGRCAGAQHSAAAATAADGPLRLQLLLEVSACLPSGMPTMASSPHFQKSHASKLLRWHLRCVSAWPATRAKQRWERWSLVRYHTSLTHERLRAPKVSASQWRRAVAAVEAFPWGEDQWVALKGRLCVRITVAKTARRHDAPGAAAHGLHAACVFSSPPRVMPRPF